MMFKIYNMRTNEILGVVEADYVVQRIIGIALYKRRRWYQLDTCVATWEDMLVSAMAIPVDDEVKELRRMLK